MIQQDTGCNPTHPSSANLRVLRGAIHSVVSTPPRINIYRGGHGGSQRDDFIGKTPGSPATTRAIWRRRGVRPTTPCAPPQVSASLLCPAVNREEAPVLCSEIRAATCGIDGCLRQCSCNRQRSPDLNRCEARNHLVTSVAMATMLLNVDAPQPTRVFPFVAELLL